MQQAHRAARRPDGRIGASETVPFDKEMLQRATRPDPIDATLPGIAVDPSLPLILTTRRNRLVLKQPSEFDQRAPNEDRALARLLIVCTAVAVAVIVLAAAPSFDLRAWFGAGSPSVEKATLVAPKSQANLRVGAASTEAPLETAPMTSQSASSSPLSSAGPSEARVASPAPSAAHAHAKPKLASKATASARAEKRAKRKARLARSSN